MSKLAGKNLAERIRGLREEFDLSQDYLAQKLGLTRSAISQIENGKRSVQSDELAKIAELFQVTADALLKGEEGYAKSRYLPSRSDVPSPNREKFKQVLLYILDSCGAKANVGETVIYKLLYFIDFNYYELYEEYLTGASYRKIVHGPAPCEFGEIVTEMIKDEQIKKVTTKYHDYPQKKYLPLVDVNPDKWNWSAREKEVIDKVIANLSSMDAKKISEYSHHDIPWEATEEKVIIDYEMVFYRTPAYSVRSYSEDPDE
jgi:transcriptional regulator with XRE-family HTH domain